MSRPVVSRDLWFGLGCALAVELGFAIVFVGIARIMRVW